MLDADSPPDAPVDDHARARDVVMAYLRSFGLNDATRLAELSDRFLADATAAGEPSAARSYAERAVAAWFSAVLQGNLSHPDLVEPIGRAALVLIGEPQRWTAAFLAEASQEADVVDDGRLLCRHHPLCRP